jgi:glucosamine-6-phosphate deaminase
MNRKYPAVFKKDQLIVKVFNTPYSLASQAASLVKEKLDEVIAQKGQARIVLATGASQFSYYEELIHCDIDWKKITVFHLDEYLGLPENHPASFRKYLKDRILDVVKPAAVHFLRGDAPEPEEECERYAGLLEEDDINLACIGIGENGHIAFNDPPVADFNDKKLVKIVELDQDCRKQQLGEGWFRSIEEVPTHALSLTIPAIMKSKWISCVVPEIRKAPAVKKTLEGPIDENCPASILRTHPDAVLFLDNNSSSLI